MTRWFRSVAAVLRRLLWPLPKDVEPDVVLAGSEGPETAGLILDPASGKWSFRSSDGSVFELDASTFAIFDFAGEPSAGAGGEEDDDIDDISQDDPPPLKPRDGRQELAMPATGSAFDALFGRGRSWAPRRDFRCAPWENLHTFAGPRPRRDDYGLHGDTSPLSMICPACELEQPPLTQGERRCPYCGLRLQISGTYVLWWRAAIEPALQWPPRALDGGR
ncbi:hypothetical protein [Phenylobacterium sp.]|uniref:hypothetical protein n=1 Tax=Phenylobacterium sp. TaxID=1871053 RepID=UPI0039645499